MAWRKKVRNSFMKLQIFNSLSRRKEAFTPTNPKNVGIYVCGPTVYDHPHIGNARSVVIYDILYRTLIHLFGHENVTYVRNITDVDDKINARAKELRVPISELTIKTTADFHHDMAYLKCLSPNIEPRATQHIEVMIELISRLLENQHAYTSKSGDVYFRVSSCNNYWDLSGRNAEEMISGSRIDVRDEKEDPADFVLWKIAAEGDDHSSIFNSPFGKGRPGWHIECSAMSYKYLGTDFDIHGGGADLIFPHHTNEIAQSCCANAGSHYAKYWMHNGFVTVDGEKMSKSLGNFITVKDLIHEGFKGEVIRYMLLSTHYRKPLDFNEYSIQNAKTAMDYLYRAIDAETEESEHPQDFIQKLLDDLNFHESFVYMHELAKRIHKSDGQNKTPLIAQLKACGKFLGFFQESPEEWFGTSNDAEIEELINKRKLAKENKDWQLADAIRAEIESKGVTLEDSANGITKWRKS
jgi:cysteinyl-tRNA synthetase